MRRIAHSKESLGPLPGEQQSTGLLYFIVRASLVIKEKDQPFGWSFMERVTRLELATSTLARWRSTG